ncbi:hypothetical protein Tco_1136179 [Tanacetum coccineum]
MAFIQLGWVSRVDEMILARVSSGFAGEKVRILQKSQENGQNRTNTDTGKEREYKSRENAIKGQQKSTLGQPKSTTK